MNDHHLILGQLVDFVTGQTLPDTHDERYRQKITRLLVEQKGYAKSHIVPRRQLKVNVDQKCAQVPITLTVTIADRTAMLLQYSPGSLVTRHRPALAMARLLAPYQIPLVVVTNGRQADILDGASGKIRATGLDSIPTQKELTALVRKSPFKPIAKERIEMEARIVMAFEVDGRCPCDTTVCTIMEED